MRSKGFSFAQVPTIRAKRSQFDLSQDIKTSGSVGTLYPFYCQEVYPGDTFKVKCVTVSRVSSAFVKPVMDNLFLDQYFFFVPSRLVYDRWGEVFGENKQSKWAQPSPVQVPGMATTGSGSIAYTQTPAKDSVAGYLGLPVGQQISQALVPKISVLPFRAFAKIYDDWFRDENNIDPMNIITGATGNNEFLNNAEWSPANYFGKCPKVAKFHDYFTSCLPSPQKGEPVEIGSVVIPAHISPISPVDVYQGKPTTGKLAKDILGGVSQFTSAVNEFAGAGYAHPSATGHTYFNWSSDGNTVSSLGGSLTGTQARPLSLSTLSQPPSMYGTKALPVETVASGSTTVYPVGGFAVTPEMSVGSVSVNDLRLAFQTQRMLEKDAVGGTRYTEYIEQHFGVHSPDARLQRSEFLGGKRVPIDIYQVAQTSQQSSEGQPAVGYLGAYSHSVGRSRFTKGFVEHGYVIGVMCLRYHHTYAQGIERFWTRQNRLDFYDPVFATIGEQPVYKRELFAGVENPDEVFGYNEAWADLRYRPSRVSGEMSPNLAQSFDVYHFADEYDNAPVLGKEFIEEEPGFVDRTLVVQSPTSDQFVFDILVENKAIRELPVYSVPSLIDHH